jgi:MoxR-like ATPase
VDSLSAVTNADEVLELQKLVQAVNVENSLAEYMLELTTRTRSHAELTLGVSTRGALTLYRAAQAIAFVEGRNYVIPDDIKQVAIPVLAHRVVCRGVLREGHRQRATQILKSLMDSIAVPT